ncbi:GntR family transcriptional regulator [Herbidospora galbida]|uniref:GntR family transcriptional regulator n=1 Tax=Herbidospora galbida TaxID=2575442 RepID=A0A4U3MDD8_9ACTN|nr:GntR family transcriptional regulator [Herbidospora galbida]TKK87195.1 GntR family transcriptional regulator [Herbidospora galbida]
MRLSIDPSSAEPLFDQIARSIRHALANGLLRTGDRLPPARDLANDIQVNLHTVLRAYALLRDEGLLEVRRGRGTVVVAQPPGVGDPRLARAIAHVAAEAHRVGLTQGRLVELVVHAFQSGPSYDKILDQ